MKLLSSRVGQMVNRWKLLLPLAITALFTTPIFAQESADANAALGASNQVSGAMIFMIWCLCFVASIAALWYAKKFYDWMITQDEGDEVMVKIAGHVRDGANAYLRQQYKVVTIFFIVTGIILGIVAFVFKAQHPIVPFAFLTGGFFSGLAGWFGMKTATLASSRTAQGAKNSLNQGLQVAFRSGAVMGLVVVGLGLIDITLWFGGLYYIAPMMGYHFSLEEITVTMLCFGMGASCQALFARVGGGIFTKAADVGADLVGKVEAGIPEDDPRNPATIADNVGDNVGDVAGMGADLYESYCGSILATAALGVAAFQGHLKMQAMMLLLPFAIAAAGIAVSIYGVFLVKTEEGASQRNLLAALAKGINISSALVAVVTAVLAFFILYLPSTGDVGEILETAGMPHGWGLAFGVFIAVVTGLVAGIGIGKWTEYSTSEEYAPTKRIADQAVTGPATVIIAGVAEGFYSVWVPIVIVGAAILVAFGACTGFDYANADTFALGLYGVGIAAVGMLSTLGLTLATDAYGPIADNAGGNAEMSHQDPIVRERTDALDSLGNTTAATGKGFAIGSAALTALALLAAYVEEVRIGFDRWVEPSIVGTEGEGTVKKIASGLLATNSKEEGGKNEAWLVFPPTVKEEHRDKDLQALIDLKPGDSTTVDLDKLANQGYIVNNRFAKIPDFVRYYNVTVMNPRVLVGMFAGVALAFVFCAMTMKAVGRSAGAMVEEVRRQFRDIPGIMESEAEPDYAACVAISTAAAQREMVLPAVMGLVAPIVVGLLLGVAGVMGMLAGGLTSGFAVAIMMANAGGAWDNAKKYIEAGAHGGKGTDAHKATVVGDTVGDPFKDTSGPSLNILIKLMSMVSVVFAGLIVKMALGM
ncbi:putative K(+)-stimulated pyrophosphate-energized sodium pump [Symmachiella macrocystis]|uniref:Putative K(+)-stimulated pyrophosphate-energized sodium pump n=2 Tax=Symmachiella macrocystis TaxID=2527985 RepID=A0A5C6BS64_9PLAN|nr:sodium-translocating pyrophosphatase [Symmachiella macrocystis]TWU13729.1 putative K(+)-stimulated pyrophosphate-energized sodium pump [Symmachiella macrocystis]